MIRKETSLGNPVRLSKKAKLDAQSTLLPERVGPGRLVPRTELLRLIQQAIHELGYHDLSREMEVATGLDTTHSSVWL